MPGGDVQARKAAYFSRLSDYLRNYRSILICQVDNVGSNQMHQIRRLLRGNAVILMGKNTMVRKVIRSLITEKPELERLLTLIRGNVGLVFTNADLKEIRDMVTSNRVRAPAKAGALAPCDVFVPAGNTGMEPGKTSFFQALSIPTKIARGTIEIVSDVHLIKSGTKVGPSEATLLNMLNISPFTYGLSVLQVYDDGATFDPSILDITDEVMLERLSEAISEVACLSLALHHPSVAAVPHLLINGFKDLAAISLASDYCIDQVKELKELLENPEALAAAQAAASASVASEPSGDAAASEDKEEKKEEAEESDDDMGFGLFD